MDNRNKRLLKMANKIESRGHDDLADIVRDVVAEEEIDADLDDFDLEADFDFDFDDVDADFDDDFDLDADLDDFDLEADFDFDFDDVDADFDDDDFDLEAALDDLDLEADFDLDDLEADFDDDDFDLDADFDDDDFDLDADFDDDDFDLDADFDDEDFDLEAALVDLDLEADFDDDFDLEADFDDDDFDLEADFDDDFEVEADDDFTDLEAEFAEIEAEIDALGLDADYDDDLHTASTVFEDDTFWWETRRAAYSSEDNLHFITRVAHADGASVRVGQESSERGALSLLTGSLADAWGQLTTWAAHTYKNNNGKMAVRRLANWAEKNANTKRDLGVGHVAVAIIDELYKENVDAARAYRSLSSALRTARTAEEISAAYADFGKAVVSDRDVLKSLAKSKGTVATKAKKVAHSAALRAAAL